MRNNSKNTEMNVTMSQVKLEKVGLLQKAIFFSNFFCFKSWKPSLKLSAQKTDGVGRHIFLGERLPGRCYVSCTPSVSYPHLANGP